MTTHKAPEIVALKALSRALSDADQEKGERLYPLGRMAYQLPSEVKDGLPTSLPLSDLGEVWFSQGATDSLRKIFGRDASQVRAYASVTKYVATVFHGIANETVDIVVFFPRDVPAVLVTIERVVDPNSGDEIFRDVKTHWESPNPGDVAILKGTAHTKWN